MLLDRIDIDEHGPLNRVELGPLGEQLNVVFAPIGSGKTAIARFIRDTLVKRDYPTGMLSSSTGRVVWATGTGLVHCHREQDGTRQGRQRVQFEPRGAADLPYHSAQSSWLDSIGSNQVKQYSHDTLALPESIVDGVITDTSVSSAAKIVASCLSQGLDQRDTYRDLPMTHLQGDPLPSDQREHVRAELSSVDAELARIGEIAEDRQTLLHRRDSLNSQLLRWHDGDRVIHPHHGSVTFDQLQRRGNELQTRARQLRSRQTELRGWISDLEKQFESRRAAGSEKHDLQEQLERLRQNLSNLTAELDSCLEKAADVRHSMRWAEDRRPRHYRYSEINRDALLNERRRIEERLTTLARHGWLVNRRNQLHHQLGQHSVAITPTSPLAAIASQWLARLSGGRLKRIDWTARESTHRSLHHRQGVAVRINERPETEYTSPDRAIAALAIRMAAGQLLARIGRRVPLVVETQREMWQTQRQLEASKVAAYCQPGEEYRYNHPLVAALRDYAAAGHQVVVLTSDRQLMLELSRTGARQFDIHAQHIVHGHQPLWRPHYAGESYIGPHPHVRGQQDLDPFTAAVHPRPSSVDQINHDFDLASSSLNGNHATTPYDSTFYGSDMEVRHAAAEPKPVRFDEVVHQPTASSPPHSVYRDGYYYADQYTTLDPAKADQKLLQSNACSHCGTSKQDSNPTIQKPKSPFLLSVDSPIDQAPSIDAVAAARLRGLNVTHITHLMQQDANRLSDALGFATVDAGTVRRWQAESRLCCRVPQLRNFDARILVGCGITTPAQLASIHPTDLLHDVELFLATEQGQQILRSGSSQELARITTWIATANSGAEDAVTLPGEVVRRGEASTTGATSTQKTRFAKSRRSREADRQHSRSATSPTRSRRADARRSRGTEHGDRVDERNDRHRRRQRRVINTEPQRFPQGDRHEHSDAARDVVQYESQNGRSAWKFYLNRDSPVEAAPAIGEKMAERLSVVGVDTVSDLLEADPDLVAEELNHRRVDADTVVQWQQQATLVCCTPMLRGHDAQLLVAAEITTTEDLAACDPEELFAIIDPISHSSQGARIIRGGKLPDLAEVTNWVAFAQHTRELKAA
jgi:hypothetical protein